VLPITLDVFEALVECNHKPPPGALCDEYQVKWSECYVNKL
jgi:hypothetical protein